MRTYTVKFFYGTDLRTDWTGEAVNDIIALSLAFNDKEVQAWATSSAFKIEITSAGT